MNIKIIDEFSVKEPFVTNLENTIMGIKLLYISILGLWNGIGFKHIYYGSRV